MADVTTIDTGTNSTLVPPAGAEKPHRGRKKKVPVEYLRHFFTKPGEDVFASVEWETRSATILNEKGEVVFEQNDLEFPTGWSQMATNVVASKYFRGQLGTPERETSVRQLIGRVAGTIAGWGREGGYFSSGQEAEAFEAELTHILLHQKAAFNSPVWFNVGVEEHPQCSACFINSVDDTLDSIMTLAKTEGMLFKYGSGTGSNLSTIRSSLENLAGGGVASGPVSFMKGFDAFAGVIKSGGKTRRAAKMVILNVDHPDIEEFIKCKAQEERKAWALIDAGFDGSLDGPAYSSVFFQNSNNSVRVPDEFMRAVEEDETWTTHKVTTGEAAQTYRARDLMRMICEAAHECGDPGLQFDTTINLWHTAKNTDRIHASNPCSEYMFLNDTACNLASLNLLTFVDDAGHFDLEAYRHTIRTVFTAMEIIVGNASYPTPKIEANSHRYRPLGIGYANLGALLMTRGLPYDSDGARAQAGALTALLTGEAYATSAWLASRKGAFDGFEENREPMLGVMELHRSYVARIDRRLAGDELVNAAAEAWNRALDLGREYGYRNSQASVLAPTGTIAFMMDCDTTGIEPDIALIKYKRLVGGGLLKVVNRSVPLALAHLGYSTKEVQQIGEYLEENDTIEDAPGLADEHLSVFDCAFKPAGGHRFIHHKGHLRMMAAVQPFISGAISKTINMPRESSVEDIEQTYLEAWRLGLKAVAIYRDGCKRVQPLSTARSEEAGEQPSHALRHRLPDERRAITHHFSVGGHEGYITVGIYPDGSPGEIFVCMAKEGSTISGLMDGFATSISMALQYGVPLSVLVKKFSHTRFEPSGFTNNSQIPIAKSLLDYLFRWLASKFLSAEEQDRVGIVNRKETAAPLTGGATSAGGSSSGVSAALIAEATAKEPAIQNDPKDEFIRVHREGTNGSGRKGNGAAFQVQEDAPSCQTCGFLMVRNGACYKCINCGSTSGCS